MLKCNPTKLLIKAWIDWFIENDFPKIQLVANLNLCDAPGFDDYPKDEPIAWNIHAAAVRNFELADDYLEFHTKRRQIPTIVRVPYEAIGCLIGIDPSRENRCVIPAHAFVYNMMEPTEVPVTPPAPEPKPRPTLTVVK